MKTIVLLIFLVISNKINSQNKWPPPDITFNYTPQMEINFRDSTSKNKGLHSDYKYEVGSMLFKNNYLYTSSLDFTFDIFGGVIQKINLENSELEWQSIYNRTNTNRQEAIQNIYINAQGNLDVYGLKLVIPFNNNFPQWVLAPALLSQPFKREIDIKNGLQINFNSSNDTNYTFPNLNPPFGLGVVYKLDEYGNIIFLKKISPVGSQRLISYKINSKFNFDSISVDTLSINSDIDADRFHNNWTEVHQVDSNKFIATLSHIDRTESKYPAKVELIIFKINNQSLKFDVLQRKDITSYFKFPRINDYTITKIIDNNIYLYDPYKIDSITNCWLAMKYSPFSRPIC